MQFCVESDVHPGGACTNVLPSWDRRRIVQRASWCPFWCMVRHRTSASVSPHAMRRSSYREPCKPPAEFSPRKAVTCHVPISQHTVLKTFVLRATMRTGTGSERLLMIGAHFATALFAWPVRYDTASSDRPLVQCSHETKRQLPPESRVAHLKLRVWSLDRG